jgi:hypothetical protein
MTDQDPDDAPQQCQRLSLLDLLRVRPVREQMFTTLKNDDKMQLLPTCKSIRKEVGFTYFASYFASFSDLA